jgi:hypothetical protein
MPFGVKKGPPTYQRAITKTFREYINVFKKIFLNDFTICNDMSTHLEKLIKCFLKCEEYGISLNPKKCAFYGVFWDYFRIYNLQRRKGIRFFFKKNFSQNVSTQNTLGNSSLQWNNIVF